VRREAYAIVAVGCFFCYATQVILHPLTLMYLNNAVSAAAAATAVRWCMCAHEGALLLSLLYCSRRLLMRIYRVLFIKLLCTLTHALL
jgi:hypothetical protein